MAQYKTRKRTAEGRRETLRRRDVRRMKYAVPAKGA